MFSLYYYIDPDGYRIVFKMLCLNILTFSKSECLIEKRNYNYYVMQLNLKNRVYNGYYDCCSINPYSVVQCLSYTCV